MEEIHLLYNPNLELKVLYSNTSGMGMKISSIGKRQHQMWVMNYAATKSTITVFLKNFCVSHTHQWWVVGVFAKSHYTMSLSWITKKINIGRQSVQTSSLSTWTIELIWHYVMPDLHQQWFYLLSELNQYQMWLQVLQ